MITKEMQYKMYDMFLENNFLTTTDLKECGFSNDDLKGLVEEKILQRVSVGYYELIKVDWLYNYGKLLFKNQNEEKSLKCFQKLFDLNPNHLKNCFELFLQCIFKGKYEESLKYFDILYENVNDNLKKDFKLYLYLLSFLTNLPDKYQEQVKNIKYKDIVINLDDKRFKNLIAYNDMRKLIINQDFDAALSQLEFLIRQEHTATDSNVILKRLLYKCIKAEKKHRFILTNLAKEAKYEEIIKYINNKPQSLSILDIYILRIVIEILKFQGKTIDVELTKKDRFLMAMDASNYELAIKSIKENCHLKGKGIINVLFEELFEITKEDCTNDKVSSLKHIIK